MKRLAYILALASLAGCVQPLIERDALKAEVKAAVLSPEITTAISGHVEQVAKAEVRKEVAQRMGDQSIDHGWGIGQINVEGGVMVILGLAALAGFGLWLRKGGQYRRTKAAAIRVIRSVQPAVTDALAENPETAAAIRAAQGDMGNRLVDEAQGKK